MAKRCILGFEECWIDLISVSQNFQNLLAKKSSFPESLQVVPERLALLPPFSFSLHTKWIIKIIYILLHFLVFAAK
jgi:hypothetical protein